MVLSHPGHRMRPLACLMVLLALTLLFAGQASTAEAGVITRWRNTCSPTGSVGTNVPVIVQASSGYSPDPLVSSSLKLFIDGALVPRWTYLAGVNPSSIFVNYNPQPALSDGNHTFRVEVTDSAGRLSANQWTARIVQPPSATWVTPEAGSGVETGRPLISLWLSDNTPGTTFSTTGQVRTGSAAGPVVATFGGIGSSSLQAFSPAAELAPGAYWLTASVSDVAGNLVQVAPRAFSTIAPPAMTVFTECSTCHPAEKTAHPTPPAADCMQCHPGYDGQHRVPMIECESCHGLGWHIDGQMAAVPISAACTSCHSASRPTVPRHTSQNVGAQHQGSCGGCHVGSIVTRHAFTPAGSAYPNQCGLCHSSADATVTAAVAVGDTSCEACHGQRHGDITAAHTFSAMPGSCVSSNCHVNTLPEAHAAFVGEGKRYPQYERSCDLCHENDDPDRVDIPSSTADCASCHADIHGDVALKHASPTSIGCFGAGCHDASRDLPTVHASYAGTGTEYGYATTCDLCHGNTDPERIDWDVATAGCTGVCHSGATHSQYASSHAVPASSSGCTVCHGTDLSGAHGALADLAKCATCHAVSGNWSKNAACTSCHDVASPHPGDRAVHEPATDAGAVMLFSNHDGMGQVDAWVDCTMCHGPANLLDVHANRCETCHLAPRNTFTTWNRTCQQAGCHATMHAGADAGHAYYEGIGDCEACHSNDWSVPIEACGGCHALVDGQAPTTSSNAASEYIGRATVSFSVYDPFPSAGIARTVYQLDGGAPGAGSSVVIPAPAAGSQEHTLAFRSEDGAGHLEATKTVSITVHADDEPPVTTSNAKASYVGVARIQLSATDNATQNGVQATYYRLNGGPVTTGTLVTVGQPASATTHTLEFWSVDSSVNEETHHTVQFAQSVDSLPPVTTTSGLNRWHTFYRMWVTLNAVDVGDSGVVASYAKVDNGPVMGGASTGSMLVNPNNYTVTDGMHTYTYWSVDAAGNIESQITTSFGVDQSAPVVSTNAVSSYTGPATITAAASDPISGVDDSTWSYRVNGGAAQIGNVAVVPAPLSGSKANVVVFTVKNGAGLTGSRTVNFTSFAGAPDVTAPTGTMSVNGGAAYTAATAVTVNSSVTDVGTGVSQMSIDPGTGTFGGWIGYGSTAVINLPAGSGTKTVTVRYRDVAGNILTLSDAIVLDTTPPAGTMAVSGGAAATGSTAVTVDSNVVDAHSAMSQMRIDPGTGTYGAWSGYSASAAITLPAGLGTKTVNVQYTDAVGNILTLSDTIELSTADTIPPVTSSTAQASYAGTATVMLTGTDNVGGSGVATTYYRLDGGPQTAGTFVVVPSPATGAAVHTLEFWSVDFAGNAESPHATAGFTVSAPGPQSQTFEFTGAEQGFTVPPDVTELTVDLYGGQGGDIAGLSGGLGGHVRAAIPVTPGEVLTLKVGGAAGDSSTTGAWPNGGNAGGTCGSAGGGSSSLLSGGSVLLEAGAGGGADHEGFDGGAGGAPGVLPGGNESGGDGAGAGGGGGWNGGSGYAEHDGGGDGGTSYIAVGAGTMTPGVRAGDGAIVIAWTPVDNAAPVTLSDARSSYAGAATISLMANDSGGSGVRETRYRIDGGAEQAGTTVSVASNGAHSLEYWSIDNADNVETPHRTVSFTVAGAAEQTGTILFGWDNVSDGSWAEVWVRDHSGNIVYHDDSSNWNPVGWFRTVVPVDSEPYQLEAHWYDSYWDVEDVTYATALIDSAGKTVTWMY